MGLQYKRKDDLDAMFANFAVEPDKLDDPIPEEEAKKMQRKAADGIDIPELEKSKEVDKALVEKERKQQKIVK